MHCPGMASASAGPRRLDPYQQAKIQGISFDPRPQGALQSVVEHGSRQLLGAAFGGARSQSGWWPSPPKTSPGSSTCSALLSELQFQSSTRLPMWRFLCSVAVTSVFVDAMSLSSSVVDDAWRGVDLHNVRATRRVGRLLTENVSVALQWLRESGPTEAGNATL